MSPDLETDDLDRADRLDRETEIVREIREAPTGIAVEEYAQAFLDNEGFSLDEGDVEQVATYASETLAGRTGKFDEQDDYQRIIAPYFRALAAGTRGHTPGPVTQNTHTAADPVSMFNGEFIHEVDDLRIDGAGIDFVFRRTYRNQVTFDGALGANWDHQYNVRLHETETELVLMTGELREQRYTRHPIHEYFVPPDGVDAVIKPLGESFMRRAPDGTRHIFKRIPTTPSHSLDRIEDRFGNFLQFAYQDNEARRLDRVQVNRTDRVVQLSYDARDRITAITDHTGRTWTYTYDDLNDLVAVTTPATDQHLDGLTTCYEYSTAGTTGRAEHNLTRIIDAEGQLYLENEFSSSPGQPDFNRVTRQRQGNGETTFEYEDVTPVFEQEYTAVQRPTHQTTLVDRNGHLIHYVYNTFGGLLFKEERVVKDGIPRTLTTRYRYNRDGQLIASMSPEGVVTQHLYGREAFARREAIPNTAEDEVAVHEKLTPEERLGFGRLLVTVRRGRYFDLPELNTAQGMWGDLFPDILTEPGASDTISKFTYEPTFGQIETVSDPRFTSSPSPFVQTASEGEHSRYRETLSRYTYGSHPDVSDSDPNLLLSEVQRPAPMRPDGTVAEPVVERFEEYDERGRLQRYVNPVGVVTTHTYVGDSDVREGYLQRTVVDPDGLAITTQFEVDELGRAVETELPRAADTPDERFVAQHMYDELDRITRSIGVDPFNFETRRFYDRNGKLEREERDAKDETGADLPAAPDVRTFEYDEEFHLIRETRGGVDPAEHLVTRHLYDSAGQRVQTVLPEGNQRRFAYDERLLQVAETRGAGTDDVATTRTVRDADGRIRRLLDARGNPTTFTLDPFRQVIAEEDALGTVIRRNYDKAGNVTVERIFERGEDDRYALLTRRETEYDELQQEIRTSNNRFDAPLGPLERGELSDAFLDHPGPGSLTETKTFYDAQGRVERTVDPLGRETAFEYDPLDRISVTVDPLNNRIENHYDAHDNLVRQDRRDEVRDSETGDVVGERVYATTCAYDTLDRLVHHTDPLGNSTEYAYDSRGNQVRRTDPLGNIVKTEFDVYNRRVTEIRERTDTGLGGGAPLAEAATRFKYDDNGNPTAVIDALGRHTEFTFDALDRRRAIIYPDESEFLFDYDPGDNLIRTRDNNGLQRHHTVDALGRTIRVDVDASDLVGIVVEGATFEQYTYDGLDRRITEENDFARCDLRYNSLDWPLKETITFSTAGAPLSTPFHIEREFNDGGFLTDVTYPNGRQLRFVRDELNRLTSVQNVLNGTGYPGNAATPDFHDIVTQMEYAGRQRLRTRFGNGAVTNYSHDGAARLIEVEHVSPAGSILQIQSLFDAVDNVRVRNDIKTASNHGEVIAYDSLYRLVNVAEQSIQPFDPEPLGPASVPPSDSIPNRQQSIDTLIGSQTLPPLPHTFTYDLVGNRDLDQTKNGEPVEYTQNELDQYTQRKEVTTNETTSFTYDANGNLKSDGQHSHIFDSDNRLVRVEDASTGSTIAKFFHDARGRRIAETVNGDTTQLICDGENLIAEYRDGQLFAQYVHQNRVDQPLQIAADGTEHWYHADLVDSARILTDQNGDEKVSYRYTPFGKLAAVSTGDTYNPLRFTARRLDGTLGTYDFRARQYTPQLGRFYQRDPSGMVDGTNLYNYSDNNPLTYADPTGTEREERGQTGTDRPDYEDGSVKRLSQSQIREFFQGNSELVNDPNLLESIHNPQAKIDNPSVDRRYFTPFEIVKYDIKPRSADFEGDREDLLTRANITDHYIDLTQLQKQAAVLKKAQTAYNQEFSDYQSQMEAHKKEVESIQRYNLNESTRYLKNLLSVLGETVWRSRGFERAPNPRKDTRMRTDFPQTTVEATVPRVYPSLPGPPKFQTLPARPKKPVQFKPQQRGKRRNTPPYRRHQRRSK